MKDEIEVRHVPSSDQLANVFTKVAPSDQLNSIRFRLTVEKFLTLSLRKNAKT